MGKRGKESEREREGKKMSSACANRHVWLTNNRPMFVDAAVENEMTWRKDVFSFCLANARLVFCLCMRSAGYYSRREDLVRRFEN